MVKICTILGTRPEIIRLSRLIPLFDNFFDHILINTNQNFVYELNKIFFNKLKLRKPDYELNNNNKNFKLGKMFDQINDLLIENMPDAIFILGDTDSSLSSIVAKRLGITIFHYEAGNRCFEKKVPEEVNRKLVDSISDINFTYSEFSRNNLLNEGKSVQEVICVGSPMKEVLNHYWVDINKSKILQELSINTKEYILISIHRQETVNNEKNLRVLFENLNLLHKKNNKDIVWPIHPRTSDKISKFGFNFPSYIKLINPQSFQDYIALQRNSYLVLSDSGTIAEETSLLGLKSLNIRKEFERQEILNSEIIPLVGLDFESWETGLKLVSSNKIKQEPFSDIKEYNYDNVSKNIVSNIITHLTRIKKYE